MQAGEWTGCDSRQDVWDALRQPGRQGHRDDHHAYPQAADAAADALTWHHLAGC